MPYLLGAFAGFLFVLLLIEMGNHHRTQQKLRLYRNWFRYRSELRQILSNSLQEAYLNQRVLAAAMDPPKKKRVTRRARVKK